MTDDRADPTRPLTLDGGDAPTPAAPGVDLGGPDFDLARPAPPLRKSRRALAMGVALAAVAAVVAAAGLLGQRKATGPAATPEAGGMQVEMANLPPPPIPKSDGPLEVLPPDLQQAAERSAQMAAVPPAAPAEEPAPVEDSARCGDTGSAADAMVCGDPGLAEADRDLDRAYARALEAGVPRRELRAEQRDWYEIREDAARRSRQAVAQVYARRIEELDRLADELQR